jgi:Fe-S-cluster-containing dehydrogenase component
MVRYGMVIDLLRCIGCFGCQLACKAENATPKGILWARVEEKEIGKFPSVRKIYLPLLCMHCREPECEKVCPTKATTKREDGIVDIDDTKCIGCRYCMTACPYGSRYFMDGIKSYFDNAITPYEDFGYKKWQKGVTVKCNMCKDRIENGIKRGLNPGIDRAATPACVINCMSKARYFGDLDDPTSEVSRLIATGQAFQLLPEIGTDPQVYYLAPGRLMPIQSPP